MGPPEVIRYSERYIEPAGRQMSVPLLFRLPAPALIMNIIASSESDSCLRAESSETKQSSFVICPMSCLRDVISKMSQHQFKRRIFR